jgi:hypothetical protein
MAEGLAGGILPLSCIHPPFCRAPAHRPYGRLVPGCLVGRPARKIHAPACHRCTLARGAGSFMEVYTTHERVICPKHSLWIGEGVAGIADQFSVRDWPQITVAWHHHKNLITRHGHRQVRVGFKAADAINWRWHEQFLHFSAAAGIYDDLAAALPRQANTQALVTAALYPSAIMLTAAIASPFWRRIACSPHPEVFLERVSHEITDGWTPRGTSNPLRHWMETSGGSGKAGTDTIFPHK